MILTCPACSARYRLAENAIPPAGRLVRCASCQHSWFETAPAPGAAAAADPVPHITTGPALPSTAPLPARGTWWWTISALVAALVLTVLAASVWRVDLQLLGVKLPATVMENEAVMADTPLVIAATVQLRVLPSGGNFMAVNGTITNPGKIDLPVVAMVADLLDARGKVLDSWSIPAPLLVLPAGRSVGFDSAASNVAPEATSLSVHFPGVVTKK